MRETLMHFIPLVTSCDIRHPGYANPEQTLTVPCSAPDRAQMRASGGIQEA